MNNKKNIFTILIFAIIISYYLSFNKILKEDSIISTNNKINEKEIKIIIKYTKKTNTIINHFNQLKEAIEAENKNYVVIGEDYKLEGIRKIISNIIIALELIITTIITCSDSVIYITRNYIPRSYFDWTHKYKILKVVFIFIIGNIINSIINNIRPFEIYYNGKLIWSGINHKGKLIRANELIKILKKKYNL